MAEITYRSNSLQNISSGGLQVKYSANYSRILRYSIDFTHKALNLHKDVSAPELFILQSKVDALMASWDEKYIQYCKRSKVVSGKGLADEMTVEAVEKLESLERILHHTLKVDDRINWNDLKNFSSYNKSNTFLTPEPSRRTDEAPQFNSPKITFWDTILGKKSQKIAAAKLQFDENYKSWEATDKKHQSAFNNELKAWHDEKERFLKAYSDAKKEFLDQQAAENAKVDALVEALESGEAQAVIEHATMVLDNSNYKDLFEKSFEIDYIESQKTLLLDYELPSPDKMPTVKAVKFVSTTGELKESHISDKDKKINFDNTCYQICLRSIHELFEADEFKNISRILFNGYSTYIDKTVGRSVRACILSILVDRDEFEAIDLKHVEPKACFKKLKGVSASTLSALAPIPPIMEMNRYDKRFIDARETADNLNVDTNLAAMSWEDFEHLVRELFEKEFASRGGEVKVTQSSSDGGVDAVAFDPDPISGGKIVIQAKRYTRTVGVSAVRDLYGTLLSEGASKGILVTTADYGPDAHKFAQGKPITLLSGSNLLHLLSKHGYQMKIDLREARQELNLSNRY